MLGVKFICYFQIVKDGCLERRIGDRETITAVALERWLKWKAKDAYILLKKESFFFNPGVWTFSIIFF